MDYDWPEIDFQLSCDILIKKIMFIFIKFLIYLVCLASYLQLLLSLLHLSPWVEKKIGR